MLDFSLSIRTAFVRCGLSTAAARKKTAGLAGGFFREFVFAQRANTPLDPPAD
jgi:hypothetical protein